MQNLQSGSMNTECRVGDMRNAPLVLVREGHCVKKGGPPVLGGESIGCVADGRRWSGGWRRANERLVAGHAAVNHERRAVDEACLVAGQVERRRRDVFGLALRQ